MDIKDLNKTQFLLVIFLVMLMTSAATAVVTIALFDQTAKSSFGGKIDRVVERTIEKIVPGATTTIVRIVREIPTPVANEGEAIAKAVDNSLPSLVQLQNKTASGSEKIGTGVVVSSQLIATASRLLPENAQEVTVVFPKATSQANVVYRDESGVAFLRIVATSTNLVPFVINASSTGGTGQTSISLILAENNTPDIVTGLILGVSELVSNSTTTVSTTTQEVLRTSSVTERNVGGPVLNAQGDLIGIGISRGYALSIKSLKALIDQLK